MKSKQSSSKKVSWPYFSNPTNSVLRDTISNSSIAVDSPQMNNVLSILNSRIMQKPALHLTSTKVPALS